MRLYRSDDHLPECFRPDGCPVEDLATDEVLTEQIDKFLTAKGLYQATEDPRVQQKAFEELGLYEDSKTHLELEKIYAKWNQLQKSQMKHRS